MQIERTCIPKRLMSFKLRATFRDKPKKVLSKQPSRSFLKDSSSRENCVSPHKKGETATRSAL